METILNFIGNINWGGVGLFAFILVILWHIFFGPDAEENIENKENKENIKNG